MPFVEANARAQADLTDFFINYIKHPIEAATDLVGFTVERSNDSLLILDQIISDIADADYVICDLSGPLANPNVMFELGIRLSVSHKPTILIREDCDSNKRIFDVSGLYTHPYKLTQTRQFEIWLVGKIREYETGLERYSSSVLKILNHDAAFWMQLPIAKACAFLGGISSACEAYLDAFARAVSLHLHKKGKADFYISASAMTYKSLGDISKEQSLMDDFGYSISSIPSLDSYLSSVYLLGLIESDIERDFRGYAMAYSIYFNKNNSSHFWPNKYEEGVAYAFETLLLMNLCRCIIRILRARPGSAERAALMKTFREDLSKSQFSEEKK
jgi:hypothetical protein